MQCLRLVRECLVCGERLRSRCDMGDGFNLEVCGGGELLKNFVWSQSAGIWSSVAEQPPSGWGNGLGLICRVPVSVGF